MKPYLLLPLLLAIILALATGCRAPLTERVIDPNPVQVETPAIPMPPKRSAP